jgi:hypothetical protein
VLWLGGGTLGKRLGSANRFGTGSQFGIPAELGRMVRFGPAERFGTAGKFGTAAKLGTAKEFWLCTGAFVPRIGSVTVRCASLQLVVLSVNPMGY